MTSTRDSFIARAVGYAGLCGSSQFDAAYVVFDNFDHSLTNRLDFNCGNCDFMFCRNMAVFTFHSSGFQLWAKFPVLDVNLCFMQ